MSSRFFAILLVLHAIAVSSIAQSVDKYYFHPSDSASGYYLVVRPVSGPIRGTLLLMTSFSPPESLLPETRLHNIAAVNGLLTVYVSMGMKLYADSAAIARIHAVAEDLRSRFGIDPGDVVLGGYENAGTIALRYAELANEYYAKEDSANGDSANEMPLHYFLRPKAVFAVDSPVDLEGFWKWCEGQVRKNFNPGAVADAHAFMDIMTKEHGRLRDAPAVYTGLTPFAVGSEAPGNEKSLAATPVRLYYDTDIQWRLVNRRNSLYDTDIPDATEMIKRLMLMGSQEAEFVSSKAPGMRSNGLRRPSSLSIVDEVDCIQWVKHALNLFDPVSWHAPYTFPVARGWTTETFGLAPDFAPSLAFKGVEDLRFHPGWADAGSEGYWTYVFCWWSPGTAVVDKGSLEENLRIYYDGLVHLNTGGRHIPADKAVATAVRLGRNGSGGWSGTIRMLDYMSLKPIELHVVIRVCTRAGKTAVLLEATPQPAGHPVWKQMDAMINGFEL